MSGTKIRTVFLEYRSW